MVKKKLAAALRSKFLWKLTQILNPTSNDGKHWKGNFLINSKFKMTVAIALWKRCLPNFLFSSNLMLLEKINLKYETLLLMRLSIYPNLAVKCQNRARNFRLKYFSEGKHIHTHKQARARHILESTFDTFEPTAKKPTPFWKYFYTTQ